MEDEEEGWTLADIAYGAADVDRIPPRDDVLRLATQMRQTWMDGDVLIGDVLKKVCQRFGIAQSTFVWSDFDRALKGETWKLGRLLSFAKHHGMEDTEVPNIVHEIADIIYNVRDVLKHTTRLMNNMSPHDPAMRNLMPEEARMTLEHDNENIDHHDESNNTNFQNAFCHLRHILQGCNYRRAAGKFFERVVVEGKIETLAFRESCTIEQFVAEHTSYDRHFQAWRWITNPPKLHDNMIEFLKDRPLSEAPDLEENLRYRSYGGDKYGRGAGVYDCRTDMIFWYHMRDQWDNIASKVTAIRQRLYDPKYECSAPRASDVCVVHLAVAFPHDIPLEMFGVGSMPLHLRWREADVFECQNGANELPIAELAPAIRAKSPVAWLRTGRAWHPTYTHPANGSPIVCNALRDALRDGRWYFTDAELDEFKLGALPDEAYIVLGEESFAMPFVEAPPTRAHVQFSQEEWDAIATGAHTVTARSFCKEVMADGSIRYYRVYAGRTWMDSDTPEIDHIFKCQQFVPHDCFFVYALMGRLFFEVGELDTHEMTLFFEGIGGSGKSTLLKAMMVFWPPHLRAILSSNMQPQFGMSSLAHGAVCFCQEVSQELNLPQEEWQDATGGAWLNLAVKHKDPMVVRWKAQFMWAGNAFPKRYKNGQAQVSRRLAGVGMYHPVKPRDGKILAEIERKTGQLQRRCVLAYFEFLRQTGSIDPMSKPEKLPPAFREYYWKGRRETDPIEDFLSEGIYVAVKEGECMLMSDFKDLYERYRTDKGMPKTVRWSEDAYRTPFSERGIRVVRKDSFTHGGQDYTNVDVVINLVAVT